jgi:hypothetical protein
MFYHQGDSTAFNSAGFSRSATNKIGAIELLPEPYPGITLYIK